MKCAKAQELFSSYMEDTIETPLRVELEQHIEECQSCKTDYDRLNATVMLLEELPQVETPRDFHSVVMARVEQARRKTPHRVKWWAMDWQQVFTIRVPAKALATGLAAVLLSTVLVQLTPLNSVVAGWLPWNTKSANVLNVGDQDAPAPWKPWGTDSNACSTSNPGLSVCVKVNSESSQQYVYDLKIHTDSNKAVDFGVYMTQNGGSTDNLISNETVTNDQSRVVPIVVAKSEDVNRSVVAKIVWTYDGAERTEYVFLPSNFDQNASGKSLSMSFKNESIYDVLSKVSAEYGSIVFASGNMSRTVGELNIESATLDQALFQSAKQSKMKRQEITTSTYVVEPIQ